MQNILKILRYVVFAFFVICNAIIASVAVWNMSLAQSMNREFSVNTYLVFLGAFGLAFIFTIIFLELARKDVVTGRIWFECAWVGLFFVMNLAGASALSAIVPQNLCSFNAVSLLNVACISTRVLLAFTWIITIILLAYFCCLITISILYQKHDPTVWQSNILKFPWPETRVLLPNGPPTPTLPRFKSIKKPVNVVAPIPRRAAPTSNALYSYRSGLGLEYEIEHYQPPSPSAINHLEPLPYPPPNLMQTNLNQGMSGPTTNTPSPYSSLYPQHMQNALQSLPQPVRAHTYPSPQERMQIQLQPSPPPLGNWPRPDVLSQTTPSKRRGTHPSGGQHESTLAGPSNVSSPPLAAPPSSFNNRSRPSGPRRRSTSSGDNQLGLDFSRAGVQGDQRR